MGRVEIEVETSIDRIDASEWNRLEAQRSFYQSYPWLSWAESQSDSDAAYLMARLPRRSGRRLIAAVPTYLMAETDTSWSSWYDPLNVLAAEHAEARARRPCWFPLLLVGSRAGYQSDVLVDEALDSEQRRVVARALVAECRSLAQIRKARSVAMMYAPSATARTVRGLVGALEPVPASANARINAQWGDLQTFLDSFPRRRRYNLQREVEVFRSGRAEVVEARLSECVDQVGPLLANVHRKHGAADTNAETTRYLKSQMSYLDHISKVFIEVVDGEPVGFSLCYEWGRQLHARVVGFDYEQSARFAYFNLAYYLPLQYAIERRLEALHLGPGTYEAKVSRGAVLDATWSVVWAPDDDNARWFDLAKRPGEDAVEAGRWVNFEL